MRNINHRKHSCTHTHTHIDRERDTKSNCEHCQPPVVRTTSVVFGAHSKCYITDEWNNCVTLVPINLAKWPPSPSLKTGGGDGVGGGGGIHCCALECGTESFKLESLSIAIRLAREREKL